MLSIGHLLGAPCKVDWCPLVVFSSTVWTVLKFQTPYYHWLSPIPTSLLHHWKDCQLMQVSRYFRKWNIHPFFKYSIVEFCLVRTVCHTKDVSHLSSVNTPELLNALTQAPFGHSALGDSLPFNVLSFPTLSIRGTAKFCTYCQETGLYILHSSLIEGGLRLKTFHLDQLHVDMIWSLASLYLKACIIQAFQYTVDYILVCLS